MSPVKRCEIVFLPQRSVTANPNHTTDRAKSAVLTGGPHRFGHASGLVYQRLLTAEHSACRKPPKPRPHNLRHVPLSSIHFEQPLMRLAGHVAYSIGYTARPLFIFTCQPPYFSRSHLFFRHYFFPWSHPYIRFLTSSFHFPSPLYNPTSP